MAVALEDVLSGAQNVLDDQNSKFADYETALADLLVAKNSAIAEINPQVVLPSEGKFYRIKGACEAELKGYYITGNTNSDGGRIALTEVANDASTIFYYADGKLLSYTSGLYIGLNNSHYTFSTVDGKQAASAITFAASPRKVGTLTVKSADRYLHYKVYYGTVELDRCEFDTDTEHDWIVEEVTWLPVAMNTTVGWATFYSPVQLKLSFDRVKAYTGLVEGNVVKLHEQSVVPANTGVILELQQGAEVENGYVFLEISKSENVVVEDNDLSGTFADTYVAEEAYVLANASKGVGLYKATLNQQDGTSFLNQGFKAYLPASAKTAGAPMFSFTRGDEEDTTGIELISNDGELVIYDLAGRRVEKMEKGIYIVNGKKVIK